MRGIGSAIASRPEVEAFAEAVDATVTPHGGRAGARVHDVASIGCMNDILPMFPTRNSDTSTTTHGFFDPQLESILGRGSFDATSYAHQYGHFLNDARWSASYAAAVSEAWGRL
eukprot:jgi/Tetstr1/423057/TSEL_013828.t1